MKIQTKITLLLLLVVTVFMAGLWGVRAFDQRKFRRITLDRFNERNEAFDLFLKQDGEPLQTLADYDSAWDQMVDAIQKNDKRWFEENVNEATLIGYKAHVAWIYRPDGSLIYSHRVDEPDKPPPPPLPLPRDAFEKLFAKEPTAHFFMKIDGEVMELRGATVHPSLDTERRTPRKGFFFVARRWNRPELDGMSTFSGTKISLVAPGTRTRKIQSDPEKGVIVFSRTLPNWDGTPLAELIVRYEIPSVEQLNHLNERLILLVFAFALVLLLLIHVAMVNWVSQPLRRIMATLERNDPQPIEQLCQDESEFGELARTTRKFFEQRDNLVREMEERRATEEALRKSEEELRHSQKMEAVGRLAGGVAHDFNNLLTAIIGYAELIATRSSSNSVAKQNAELIRKAGEQAAALTRQLLAFSRKQILQPKVIDLNTLVVEIEEIG